jgi:uncharacterized damage-inducible protein DinB
MNAVAVSPAVGPATARAGAPAIRALRGQLQSLRRVVVRLPPAIYRAAPSQVSGSVGAHVRHCLDHARALVAQPRSGELCYDSRLRGTPVETEPLVAVDEIDRLCLDLEDLRPDSLADEVRLRSMTDRDGTAVHVRSTFGREVAFVIQHTIHHAAIIALLLHELGIPVPPDFGYAPSTPARS